MNDTRPFHHPASLARSTLIKMGVRIAVIIALITFFSYLHMFRSLRAEALLRLETYVSERSQRESAIFVQAEDNHAFLKAALKEQIQTWSQQDPSARFDSLFEPLPDGTLRNRIEGFDGKKMPGVFVPRGLTVDADLRRRILAAHDVLVQHAPAFHVRFKTTYIMLPEGVLVGYWPEASTWSRDVDESYSIANADFFILGLPRNNPQRKTVWSGIFMDEATRVWMVSGSTPLDVEGRHVASINHDLLLDDLMTRTLNDYMPGAYNVLFRDDGQLIAYPELSTAGAATAYNILGDTVPPAHGPAQPNSGQQRAHLRSIFERVRSRLSDQVVMELPAHGEYIAAARLRSTGWNFVTVLPEHVVSGPAFQAARYVLLLGVASLLIELAILYWVLRQQITRPLLAFTQAADQIAAGNFKVALSTSRNDELGQLANAFQLMTGEVQQREEALRQANERLEQRVEERTRELKEVHQRLVVLARQAGMAEIATNVLHNVGNVLTSVRTSTAVARKQLAELRLEHVGRVASMIEEHENDLAAFFTQEERGRKVRPYLSQLGQHLVEERQEISTLLEEVDRFTEHIGTIVKLQQNYARVPQLSEPTQVVELVEDALRIHEASLTRHHVKVERQLALLPLALLDKHKVLMILVNLISNAKYALDALPEDKRLLTLRMESPVDARLRLSVQDNGIGIAPELLTRIFQHGFTTRKEGHGFGLHSSAVTAQQMGGSLSVHSDGPGRGAIFTLELPYQPAEVTA